MSEGTVVGRHQRATKLLSTAPATALATDSDAVVSAYRTPACCVVRTLGSLMEVHNSDWQLAACR